MLSAPAFSAYSQKFDFIPAVRLQLIADNPEAWGGSFELCGRDSVERHWITVRILSVAGQEDYTGAGSFGFDISDKFRAVGVGLGLTSQLMPTWALDYGLYLDYMWGHRAVVGDPLNLTSSYYGKGFDPSAALRLRLKLGEVVQLSFGFEVGYRWILSIEHVGSEITDRPIGDDWFAACSTGLVFRLQ